MLNDAPNSACPPPAETPEPRCPGDCLAMIRSLARDIAAVRELIAARLSTDDVQRQAFQRLYDELDRTKRHATVLDNRPLYLDLILFYDRLQACSQDVEPQPILRSLRDEFQHMMFRRDIHLISLDQDTFDPRYQRAVLTEDVTAAAMNGKVLRVLRDGFTCGEVVLRPQEVVVGRLSPTADVARQPVGSADTA